MYLRLWKDALALGRAAAEFRELKFDSGKTDGQHRREFVEAHHRFNRRVYDFRPFYDPKIYELTRGMLRKSADVYRLQGRSRHNAGHEENAERLLDEINNAIDPLCDAIRGRIWARELTSASVHQVA